MRFAHVNIIALDWKKLLEFYTKTFNCELIPPVRKQSGEWLEKGTGLKDAKLEGAHLLLPGYGKSGPTLEIYQYESIKNQPPTMPNTRGFGHIAFEVDNVEEVLQKLEENGGKKSGELTKREVPGVGEITFVYARDPEGNIIEVQNWKREVGNKTDVY